VTAYADDHAELAGMRALGCGREVLACKPAALSLACCHSSAARVKPAMTEGVALCQVSVCCRTDSAVTRWPKHESSATRRATLPTSSMRYVCVSSHARKLLFDSSLIGFVAILHIAHPPFRIWSRSTTRQPQVGYCVATAFSFCPPVDQRLHNLGQGLHNPDQGHDHQHGRRLTQV